MELMLYDEAPVLAPPQPLPGARYWEQCSVPVRPRAVGVDPSWSDPWWQPSWGSALASRGRAEGAHGGGGVADIVEVGEVVEDQHVGDPVVPGKQDRAAAPGALSAAADDDRHDAREY